MASYIFRKLAWSAFDLIVILTISFGLSYLLPGDPARAVAGPHASMATIHQIRQQLGLDRPVYIQYVTYLSHILELNFGTSIEFHMPVWNAISSKLLATGELALTGLLIELLIGVPWGIFAALYSKSVFARITGLASMVSVSLPQFWVGIILLFFLGFKLHLFPLGGYGTPVIWYVLLPGLTLGIGGAAFYTQLVKTRLLDILGQPFIQTAKARGVPKAKILWMHVMPNALTTLVTQMGMDFGYFMAGVVVVEAVFGWPGIGLQAWEAIQGLDIPLIMGTVLFGAFWTVLLNFIVDIIYALLDPRIRLS